MLEVLYSAAAATSSIMFSSLPVAIETAGREVDYMTELLKLKEPVHLSETCRVDHVK